MDFQSIVAAGSPEVQSNENFETINFSSVYGKRQPVTDGLTWGYYGGRWGGFSVAAGTHTLTDSATNYIVAKRSDGVTSVSTATTNWNNTTDYARVYKLTTSGGVVTAVEDHRAGAGGIHGSAAAAGAGTEIKGLTFTSDTGSTADSDPGNGLFKWNNATQGSATVLYFDNQTADGVSLTTLWGSLASTGFIYLQQSDDATKWQMWKWTAAPVDGTGYRKFTVTLQAQGGSIADDKTVYCDFESDAVGVLTSQNNTFTKAQRFAYTSLTSSAGSIAVDLSLANNFNHTLTENTTLAAPSNVVAGQKGVIEFTQHASAAKTLAYNSFWKWAGAAPVSISATVGSKNVMAYVVDSSGTFATCGMVVEVG